MLAEQKLKVPAHHRLLAPTLLRSQVLAHLFGEVQRGLLTRKEADHRLDYLRGLQIRLLGDRVLQQVAWRFAEELGWKDTFVAEYLALTKLQADALVTRDLDLRRLAGSLVAVAAPEDLHNGIAAWLGRIRFAHFMRPSQAAMPLWVRLSEWLGVTTSGGGDKLAVLRSAPCRGLALAHNEAQHHDSC